MIMRSPYEVIIDNFKLKNCTSIDYYNETLKVSVLISDVVVVNKLLSKSSKFTSIIIKDMGGLKMMFMIRPDYKIRVEFKSSGPTIMTADFEVYSTTVHDKGLSSE